jgi:DNA-binding transcriptional LysR family regulator
MTSTDWLRTFVAIYRAGSVSAGAAQRGLSQPAASQHLSALERRVGLPLFTRTPLGVEPTRRGRELLAEVSDSLDRLEPMLAGLEGGSLPTRARAVRFGSSAEFFAHVLGPLFGSGPDTPRLTAQFEPDGDLIRHVEQGELDLVVTSAITGRRALSSTPIGSKRFVLVGPPALIPPPEVETLVQLGSWLVGKPWVAFSAELPLTRRFWLSSLGRPFGGDLRLVAPDLRAVADAVAHGLGVSLLPDFVCTDALSQQRIAELYPVAEVVPAEQWFASTRIGSAARPAFTRLVERLATAIGGGPSRAPDTPAAPPTGRGGPTHTDQEGTPSTALPSSR